MTDHFAVLHQPRRPWLDAEALKEEFHREAAAHHPDVNGGEGAARFVALNAAYSVLREPASRLRHFLELEAPERLSPSQAIPAALGDLFMQIAAFRQAAQAFRKKEAAASSALGVSLLAEERLEVIEKGRNIHARLSQAIEEAMLELREADSDWQNGFRQDDNLDRLIALNHRLAYLIKWLPQITEDLPSGISSLDTRNPQSAIPS